MLYKPEGDKTNNELVTPKKKEKVKKNLFGKS